MKYAFSIIFLVMLAMLTGCTTKQSDKPKVTVSIPPQKYLLEQIAGDRVDVVTLMDGGTNPETYQPTMSTMGALEESLAYFTVGTLPFEQELVNKLVNNASEITIIDTSKGVTLLHGTHGDHCDGDHHHHGEGDPHIWSSVSNARIMARNMADGLAKADPDNADFYRANLATLESRLDSLDQAYRNRLAATNVKAFAVMHPSLSYFANDYGLEQIAVGQEGKESTVNQRLDMIKNAQSHGTTVMFVQKEFDSRQAQTISDEIGTSRVTINPMSENWEAELNTVVNALTGNE